MSGCVGSRDIPEHWPTRENPRGPGIIRAVAEHWDIDSPSPIEESYEPPVLDADPDLIADLRAAIALAEDVHEAWLVAKRVVWGEREKVGLGVVAHVGGRWRAKKQIAALGE